ncbi:9267_t:CDS:2 [Paraglomus brasilianum]|uniref:DNA polymerase n=1 Tax=Paraglomus brasilianum TaxID=144538 RepID=A0A9N9CBM4_9GLOM|nr:9267_t:CDS:2 [Paraglomus brasilianum]
MTARNAQLERYDGGETLEGIPTRNDIVTEFDNGMTAVLQQSLSAKQSIHFMPTDVSDEAEYIKGVSTYILRISGALINGQKAIVDITGIKPFFDIEVPETTTYPLSVFKRRLINILTNTLKNTSKFGIETISAFPLRGYHTERKSYIRVTTWNQFDRYNALKAVREVGISTASDDLNPTYYYRKVAREKRLPLSSWAVLSNYSYKYIGDSSLNTYSFQVAVNNYNPINDDDYNNPLISSALTRDRTLILTWDIETYSSLGLGNFPTEQSNESNVFMICMTVHWKDDPEPLKQICLVDVETAPDPRRTTIICESQTNLLKAFALCRKLLAPDIQIGFNDSQYDWKFIVEKAKKLGVLEWMFNQMSLKPLSLEKITKWQYQYNAIKVNDRNFYSKHLKIPGCVAIDVRPCFMKFYSKAEKSSLAYYLKECKLDNKLDMSYHRMFKYYGRALKETNVTTAEQMREVADYCIIDAISCQRLMVERNAINEYREMASVAFISVYDSHYFAVGMKVRNLLSASAWQEGILTSTIPCEQTETRKYPGAYVFPPVKGLENRRPVTGLDFASLYPSLIMTYNLSPEKIILSRNHAESLKESGKKLHEINFKFNNRDVLAWSIEHGNRAEMKGLYPKVLEELLIRRNLLKKRLAPLKDKKEELENEISLAKARGMVVTDALKSEYSSIAFNVACLDAKQLALKVYMNTFYGEAGNSGSPFFLRELAGGVTSAGQRNIKLIADFVGSKGFVVKYGDTDSLYLVCPEEYFQECDKKYISEKISKEKYWEEMVRISMKVMSELRNDVNDFLREDNGSTYLKMAYEEVLFPVVFTGKKKYYGIQHIKKPNFYPDFEKLFIKGVDIVKRGQSEFIRKVGRNIMEESMKINNNRTMQQIVEDVLKSAVDNLSQVDINECVKTSAWKPDRNNKSVQCFISRMKSKHAREIIESQQLIKQGVSPNPYIYNIPEPGERFEYIVVEGVSEKVGDRMEYPDVAKKLNKKIDINYYLKSVVGLCARFINNSKCFEPQPDSESLKNITDSDELWTAKDGIAQKSAERWLKKYIKDLRDAPKKEEDILSHLWKEVNTYAEKICSSNNVNRTVQTRICLNYSSHDESKTRDFTSSYLNALNEIENSIRLNLSDLFARISKSNEKYRDDLHNCELMQEFRNEWYREIGLVTVRRRALSHLTTQNTGKNKLHEADLDEIIDLYC